MATIDQKLWQASGLRVDQVRRDITKSEADLLYAWKKMKVELRWQEGIRCGRCFESNQMTGVFNDGACVCSTTPKGIIINCKCTVREFIPGK